MTNQGPAVAASSWIPIAQLGEFKKGDLAFAITDADVQAWKRSAASGRVLVDTDHASARGKTRAMGWVKDVRRGAGNLVEGLVTWTAEGRAAVKDGLYKFCSVEFTTAATNEHGRNVGRALKAVSLTNRPHLTDLPAIHLTAWGGVHAPSVRLSVDAAGARPIMPSLRLRDLHRRPDVDRDELRAAERAEAQAEAGGDYVDAYIKAIQEAEAA